MYPPTGNMSQTICAALEAKYRHKGQRFTRKEWDQLLGHCKVRLPIVVNKQSILESDTCGFTGCS